MRPVLFSVFGLHIQSYGVSKALAALVAAYLLARAFEQRDLQRDVAYALVLWSTVWGFAGAKVYYLFEHHGSLTMHDLGGMGFTWYGGFLAGTVAALVVVRRHQLPFGVVAGAAAVPLSLAYGIGRIGCLLSGDGTYGKPTSLPWAMTFPHGAVPSSVPVHPTPLYEALAAVLIAGLLWTRQTPAAAGRLRRLPGAERGVPIPCRDCADKQGCTVRPDAATAVVHPLGARGRAPHRQRLPARARCAGP